MADDPAFLAALAALDQIGMNSTTGKPLKKEIEKNDEEA